MGHSDRTNAVSADARAKLAPIDKGDDADLAAGTADVAALSKSVGADTCGAARRALATALNDGGFQRYQKKKYDDANHLWRAALSVRPAMVLARYNLACGLALAGKPKDAVAEVVEIARAANMLEKAKSDDDLKSVRDDADFKAALGASNAGLVGPRKEPETAAKATPLLPTEYKRVKDEITGEGFVTYKPAVTGFWTWRPNAQTELLVATIVDDPAKLGKPKGDMNQDYGAVAVFKREGEKLKLLFAKKTGESPPSVAAGPGQSGSVLYTWDEPCGSLSGVLTYVGTNVESHDKKCEDL